MRTVTFKIGTDIIGQPLYHTHFVSKKKQKGRKSKVIVRSKTHR